MTRPARCFAPPTRPPRDRALAYLLAHLCLRVSEALRLTAGDVTTTRGHRTVWVTRKRGRRQQLALSPACAQALDALLAQRPDGALFVTRTGRPLDRHHAAKIIARLGRRAGLRYPLTPHGLRHAFITLALDAGASLRDVQGAAGHADPRTTRRYDRARGNLDRSPSYDVRPPPRQLTLITARGSTRSAQDAGPPMAVHVRACCDRDGRFAADVWSVPAHWDLPAGWIEGPARDRTGRPLDAQPPAPPPEVTDEARRLRARDRAAAPFSQPPPTTPLPRRAKRRRLALPWRDT